MPHENERQIQHPGEPSVTSSLERVVVASQNMISKKIDLALLEGREWITGAVLSVLMAACGAVLACAAWFALVACVALSLPDGYSATARAAVFAVINLVVAAALLAPVFRRVSPEPTEAARTAAAAPARESEAHRG